MVPSLNYSVINRIPISVSSILNSNSQNNSYGSFQTVKQKSRYSHRITYKSLSRNIEFSTNATAGEGGSSVYADVPFPTDYTQLLNQAKEAVELAMENNIQLMVSLFLLLLFFSVLSNDNANEQKPVSEYVRNKFVTQEIEFPTAGLESVPGDGEGGIEMTGSMQLIREFCDIAISPEKATRTRIFFPEANEVTFARNSAFGGSSLKLDYLTKPSLFEDFGFVTKVKMADRVKTEDQLFIVAYPYFNVNEMLVVEELYKEAVEKTSRKLIIFNGELDRIRSGYYPPFFYPKLGALTKTLFPKLESVYYIHNFKGKNGGVLFRCYPGPWQVLRKARNKYVCLHKQETMPSLKEVALDILPSA